MIVAGRDFNFGRCIKIDFYKGNTRVLTVEHKPEIDPNYYIAMDVEVSDLPSPLESNKPGFMANVTIFNPSPDLLTTIADGATWLANYARYDEIKNMTNVRPEAQKIVGAITAVKRSDGMKRYYESRLRAHIYAGYVVDGKPAYTQIIQGYVNGSSFSHKGTDDVLKIGIYDIDINQVSTSMLDSNDEQQAKGHQAYQGSPLESKWHDEAKTKFANTWHNTFSKYVQNFETEWLTDDHQINIVYAKSKRAWLDSKTKTGREGSILNQELKQKLTAQTMPNGGISAFNMAGMLNGLCAQAKVKVDWMREMKNVSINTYVIFPLGDDKTVVAGPKAGIQIWNYQNLLESPSIDGAGKLTIKMVFNPDCACGKTIALMLTDEIKETDVTKNIASFSSSIVVGGGMLGSMFSTGNDAAVANNQITGNTNVQSQRKQKEKKNSNGYLFNTGFPIIKVEHILSTYGQEWTTIVKTTPMTAGLKFEDNK